MFNLVLSLLPAKVKCVHFGFFVSRDTWRRKLKLDSFFCFIAVFVGGCRSVVGFFGFNHDRKLALRCLTVSAGKKDVTAVFSGYVLLSMLHYFFSVIFIPPPNPLHHSSSSSWNKMSIY